MNLAQQGYRWMRAELLNGGVFSGGRVSLNTLVAQSGLGRTPVRDAVNRLAAEGLLELVDRSGITVRVPRMEELREIVELREAIEPYAAEQAATRMDYVQVARLRRLCREMRGVARAIRDARFSDEAAHQRMRALDWAFHSLILDAAGNQRLCRIVEDQHLLLHKVRYPSRYTVHHLARTLLEHWRIGQALARGDAAAARLWMWHHARRGGHAMLASSDENQRATEAKNNEE